MSYFSFSLYTPTYADTPALAAISLIVAILYSTLYYLFVFFEKDTSDTRTAANIKTEPVIIRTVTVSCSKITEKIVPNTASMDNMIADFVSSTYF